MQPSLDALRDLLTDSRAVHLSAHDTLSTLSLSAPTLSCQGSLSECRQLLSLNSTDLMHTQVWHVFEPRFESGYMKVTLSPKPYSEVSAISGILHHAYMK